MVADAAVEVEIESGPALNYDDDGGVIVVSG